MADRDRSPVLDSVAKRIIEQLQEDGRRSYASIAKAVGLSEAAVRQRVQRLLDTGVVQIVAVTDPLQVGFERQALIGMNIQGDVTAVADALAEIPEVDYVVITAGSFDVIAEVVCENDDHLLDLLSSRIRILEGVTGYGDFRLPEASQTALQLGDPMTTTPPTPSAPSDGGLTPRGTRRADAARDHVWMHFARHSGLYEGHDVPIIVRGDGARIWDDQGRQYLDGLAGLFVVQVGHGRAELAEVAARQAAQLAYFPLWSYAHPPRSIWPSGWPATRRATSTGSFSRPVAGRPSRPPGSWPSSTGSSSANRQSTR